jgi:hypothetical protein
MPRIGSGGDIESGPDGTGTGSAGATLTQKLKSYVTHRMLAVLLLVTCVAVINSGIRAHTSATIALTPTLAVTPILG